MDSLDISQVASLLEPVLKSFEKVAFVFLALGFIFMLMRASQPREYLMAIAMAGFSVALIAAFPTLYNETREAMWQEATQNRADVRQSFLELRTGIDDYTKNNSNSWVPSGKEIGDWIVLGIAKVCFWLAEGARIIVDAIQETLSLIMIAFSPLMIGFILLGATRSMAIQFLLLALSICLWPFSFVIGDIIISRNLSALAGIAGIQGGFTAVAIGASTAWAIAIVVGLILLIIFLTYLLGPVFLSWIMSGVNPAPILAGLGLSAAGGAVGSMGKGLSGIGGSASGSSGGGGSSSASGGQGGGGTGAPAGSTGGAGSSRMASLVAATNNPFGLAGGGGSGGSSTPASSLSAAPLTNSDGSAASVSTGSGSSKSSGSSGMSGSSGSSGGGGSGGGGGGGTAKTAAAPGQKKEGGGMIATQGEGNTFSIASSSGQGLPTSHAGNISDSGALSMASFQHQKQRKALQAFDGLI